MNKWKDLTTMLTTMISANGMNTGCLPDNKPLFTNSKFQWLYLKQTSSNLVDSKHYIAVSCQEAITLFSDIIWGFFATARVKQKGRDNNEHFLKDVHSMNIDFVCDNLHLLSKYYLFNQKREQ